MAFVKTMYDLMTMRKIVIAGENGLSLLKSYTDAIYPRKPIK